MIPVIAIVGGLFLLFTLVCVSKNSGTRYRYEDQEKEVWAGFNSKGLAYKKVIVKTLVEDPKGQYYSNGRKING